MEGIRFLDKHSYDDFGVTLAERSIGNPEKEKMKVKVPFSNMEYDFSRIYGSQPYSPRELKYSFNLFSDGSNSNQRMNSMRTRIINWVMNSDGKQKLYDDAFPGYYFLAEVEEKPDFDDNYNRGVLTVKFNAYSFMESEYPEGSLLWDTFNFDQDVMQKVEFTIEGADTVTLYNTGTPDVFPIIEASSAMEISLNGITYTVSAGITEKADMPLVSGENELTITGNGMIKFAFYKEMI